MPSDFFLAVLRALQPMKHMGAIQPMKNGGLSSPSKLRAFQPMIIPARDPKQCKNEKTKCNVCVTTLCEHSMCEHSMRDHSMHDHSMCDHSMGALYV